MADVNTGLERRLMAEIDRHMDHHEAATTAVKVATRACLRSVGPVGTAEFFRDAADYLEHEAILEVMQ